MARMIEIQLDDESSIFIEVDETNPSYSFESPASFDPDKIEKMGKEYLDKIGNSIKSAVGFVKDKVKELGPDKPDELELSLNIKVSTENKVILSKLGSEANFGLKLKWKKDSD